jgi:hypothetical protein
MKKHISDFERFSMNEDSGAGMDSAGMKTYDFEFVLFDFKTDLVDAYRSVKFFRIADHYGVNVSVSWDVPGGAQSVQLTGEPEAVKKLIHLYFGDDAEEIIELSGYEAELMS